MSNQSFDNFLTSLILNYPVNRDLSNNLINTDLSNNLINTDLSNNLINRDLSNNNFFSLISMIQNELPTSNQPNTFQNLLQSTLNQKNCYKNVLSKEGKTKIKYLQYESGMFEEKKCPILQLPFKNEDDIAQLPCGHIFDKNSVLQWLEEESNKCPVCRYELKSKEEKIIHTSETISSHPFGSTNRRVGFTDFLNNYYEAQENRLVQRAIEQSLLDLSNESNITDDSDSEIEIPLFIDSDSEMVD